MEVAPVDQGIVKWSPVSADAIFTTGTAVGDGYTNTLDIIPQAENAGYHGELLDYAAGMATYYKGGGKDNWFLLSIDMLTELFNRKDTIGITLDGGYWSSSEASANSAWRFESIPQGNSAKGNPYRVRAVREF